MNENQAEKGRAEAVLLENIALVERLSRRAALRKAATEFSFFLAIPTLGVATVYQLYKERALLSADDIGMWVVGFISAFISAFLCVRWLLRFISSHDFVPFAWYRIVFGIVVLTTAHFGWVQWTAH